jgi:hypothetical protein
MGTGLRRCDKILATNIGQMLRLRLNSSRVRGEALDLGGVERGAGKASLLLQGIYRH